MFTGAWGAAPSLPAVLSFVDLGAHRAAYCQFAHTSDGSCCLVVHEFDGGYVSANPLVGSLPLKTHQGIVQAERNCRTVLPPWWAWGRGCGIPHARVLTFGLGRAESSRAVKVDSRPSRPAPVVLVGFVLPACGGGHSPSPLEEDRRHAPGQSLRGCAGGVFARCGCRQVSVISAAPANPLK